MVRFVQSTKQVGIAVAQWRCLRVGQLCCYSRISMVFLAPCKASVGVASGMGPRLVLYKASPVHLPLLCHSSMLLAYLHVV